MSDKFCTVETHTAGETIFGTATAETSVWFLLEYNDPWRSKIELDNDLPQPVQAWFNALLADMPHGRLLFIKQEKATQGAESSLTRRFYVAVTTPQRQTLHAFDIETYAELLWLDVPAILTDDETYAAYRQTDETLFLVCTHGKRDKCCAKFGRPVYEALAKLAPAQTWACSHLGGHRYSAVTAVLPAGIYYGLLSPAVLPAWHTALQQGQIFPAHFRGRTCYTPAVQAAEYYLRRELRDWHMNSLVCDTAEERAHGRVVAQFAHRDGARHTVTLMMRLSEPVLASCTTGKMKPRPLFELVSIT